MPITPTFNPKNTKELITKEVKRYNSTIEIKTCKCGCNKVPKLGYSGYAGWKCLPPELKEKHTQKSIAAKNKADLRKLGSKLHKAQNANNEAENGSDLNLEGWFLNRRKEMTGRCSCGCNLKSSRDDEKYYKYSCCHVLAKSNFKSIMFHPENFVELAFWGGHHTTLDDMGYEYCKNTKPILWEIIIRKFRILYPFIAAEEHKFIPDVLLKEL